MTHELYNAYLVVSTKLSELAGHPEIAEADRRLLHIAQHALSTFAYSSQSGLDAQSAWDAHYLPKAVPAETAETSEAAQ